MLERHRIHSLLAPGVLITNILPSHVPNRISLEPFLSLPEHFFTLNVWRPCHSRPTRWSRGGVDAPVVQEVLEQLEDIKKLLSITKHVCRHQIWVLGVHMWPRNEATEPPVEDPMASHERKEALNSKSKARKTMQFTFIVFWGLQCHIWSSWSSVAF